MRIGAIDTLSIIVRKMAHDFLMYEHEVTIEELRRHHTRDTETPEEREERLHTEIAGEGLEP
ncbi:MAG TPA: hypothetical protein VNU47_01845 [Candidatus Paceibacterota bacterium]|nr:hypothetical protein [Candidatus Paceibacterota bacterium]